MPNFGAFLTPFTEYPSDLVQAVAGARRAAEWERSNRENEERLRLAQQLETTQNMLHQDNWQRQFDQTREQIGYKALQVAMDPSATEDQKRAAILEAQKYGIPITRDGAGGASIGASPQAGATQPGADGGAPASEITPEAAKRLRGYSGPAADAGRAVGAALGGGQNAGGTASQYGDQIEHPQVPAGRIPAPGIDNLAPIGSVAPPWLRPGISPLEAYDINMENGWQGPRATPAATLSERELASEALMADRQAKLLDRAMDPMLRQQATGANGYPLLSGGTVEAWKNATDADPRLLGQMAGGGGGPLEHYFALPPQPTADERAAAAFEKRYGPMGLGVGEWHGELEANPQPGVQPAFDPRRADGSRPLSFDTLSGGAAPRVVPQTATTDPTPTPAEPLQPMAAPAAPAPLAGTPATPVAPVAQAPAAAPAQSRPSAAGTGLYTIGTPGEPLTFTTDLAGPDYRSQIDAAFQAYKVGGDPDMVRAADIARSAATNAYFSHAKGNLQLSIKHGEDAANKYLSLVRGRAMAEAQHSRQSQGQSDKTLDRKTAAYKDTVASIRQDTKWAEFEKSRQDVVAAKKAATVPDPQTGMPQVAALDSLLRSLIGGRINNYQYQRFIEAAGAAGHMKTMWNYLTGGGQLGPEHMVGARELISALEKADKEYSDYVAQQAYDMAKDRMDIYGFSEEEGQDVAARAGAHFGGKGWRSPREPAGNAMHVAGPGAAPPKSSSSRSSSTSSSSGTKKGSAAAGDFLSSIGVK